MDKKHYLYGAAVQGIQNFIFQTNELKDIVGASELVEAVCTSAFDEFGSDPSKSIVRAAGNIKYDFDDEEQCKKAVLEFPKKVQGMAPGITISQAVVEYEPKEPQSQTQVQGISQAVEKYDQKAEQFSNIVKQLGSFLRIQRNCPARSNVHGLIGTRRSRKTGLPAVAIQYNDYLDEPTFKKKERAEEATYNVCEKAFGVNFVRKYNKKIPFNIGEITKRNNWIAIVHADGNGFGKIFQKVGHDKEKLSVFSKRVDELTQNAARMAFADIKGAIDEELNTPQCFIPIRPVVLNGDDLTVIIRGDLALPYANAFLKNFEKVTADELQSEFGGGLTACAGVAFIKSSYPFYYGYALAEDLCARAKNKAKKLNEDLAPSCLMFHKVQDSFVENYEKIIERELTPSVGLSFEFGPYFIEIDKQTGYWTVKDLLDSQKKLTGEEGNIIKSHLRKWIELLYVPQEDITNRNNDEVGNGLAEQYLNRFKSLLSDKSLSFSEELTTGRRDMRVRNHIEKTIKTYPTYDVLALHSIYEVVTK